MGKLIHTFIMILIIIKIYSSEGSLNQHMKLKHLNE